MDVLDVVSSRLTPVESFRMGLAPVRAQLTRA